MKCLLLQDISNFNCNRHFIMQLTFEKNSKDNYRKLNPYIKIFVGLPRPDIAEKNLQSHFHLHSAPRITSRNKSSNRYTEELQGKNPVAGSIIDNRGSARPTRAIHWTLSLIALIRLQPRNLRSLVEREPIATDDITRAIHLCSRKDSPDRVAPCWLEFCDATMGVEPFTS